MGALWDHYESMDFDRGRRRRANTGLGLVLAAPLLLLAACEDAGETGDTDIEVVLAEDDSVECDCACSLPISDSPGSQLGCTLSGGQVREEDGTTWCDSQSSRVVCIDPAAAGDATDLEGYCEAMCQAVDVGFGVTYGCASECTHVPPAGGYTVKQSSFCLDDCDELWCNDCEDLLGLELKDCLGSCTMTVDECGDGDVVGPVCGAPVDPPGVQWLDHSGGVMGDLIGYESRGNVDVASTATLTVDAFGLPLGLDGTVSVIGVPAPGEDGQAALRLDLQVDEFVLPLPVGALTVEDITVVGTSAINAIELDPSGYGEVPPGDLVAAVRYDVDAELFVPPFSIQETEAFLVTNADPIAVNVDWTGGEAAAYGSLTGVVNDGLLDHDFDLTFDLVSQLGPTGPTLGVVAIPTFIQCNTTDGALVEVEAEAIDLDQTDGFTTRWWTEDDLFSSEPVLDEAAGELFLPLGDSVVTTFVGDSSGRGTFLRTEVEVYDLVIAAVADLYDHAGGVSIQVARLDGPAVIPVAQLMPLFEDDCDSAPTVVVDEVESAGGKGEAPVLFACDGTLCLGEAPRDGGIAADYKVFVQAADRSGNTLETHLHVTVCGEGESCRFPVLETRPEPIDKAKEGGK